MANLTREQLQAMGLNEEEINAILGVTNNSNGGGLPFNILKINYDDDAGKRGIFGYNPQKDENGYLTGYEHTFEELRFTPLKSWYQYANFDSTTGSVTVKSELFESLRDAKSMTDVKTGELIVSLQETDNSIKLNRVMLVKLEDLENTYAIWYIKGKYYYELNQILQKEPNEGHLNKTFTIKNKKEKNGSITYFIPTLVKVEDRDFTSSIKEDAEAIKKFNEWAENDIQDNKKVDTSEIPEIDIDDEDIPFD